MDEIWRGFSKAPLLDTEDSAVDLSKSVFTFVLAGVSFARSSAVTNVQDSAVELTPALGTWANVPPTVTGAAEYKRRAGVSNCKN